MPKVARMSLVLVAVALVAACSASTGLTGKAWQLTAITEVTPAFQGVVPVEEQPNYTIEFKTDGTFTAKADCNSLAGTYTTTSSGGMTIAVGPSTLVACPTGSMGAQFTAGLGNAASYVIASNQLTITLTDSGTLVFK
jgi:heat shock protein HslJ